MKLTILLLTIGCLHLSASVRSQQVTARFNRASLDRVLSEVGKQTRYNFVYDSEFLLHTRPITADFKSTPLASVLETVFREQPLTYEVKGEHIFIRGAVGSHENNAEPLVLAYLEVKGRVVDSVGNALSGASVCILNAAGKRTTLQTTTDSHGVFLLKHVPADAVVEITYIGYVKQTFLASPDLGTIRLRVAPSALEEVVVNKGYYTESRKLSTGSVGRVDGETIAQQPVTNVMGALIGRVPGLEVVQGGGMPGAPFKVRIRGQNSIAASNDPLYIVDGVPFSSSSLSHNYAASHLPYIGTTMSLSPFNTLNPADIESIEVLKDADATAIYGSRGSNGVILITTKRGSPGKTQFELRAGQAYSRASNLAETVDTDTYLAIRREAYANDNITTYPSAAYDVNGTWPTDRYTDWNQVLLGGTASNLNVQGGVSGGSDRTQFLLRGGYQHETTVFPGDHRYNRGSVLANINHRSADDRFTLTLSSNYATDKNNMPTTDFTFTALYLAPNAPALYQDDGSLNWADGTWTNPLGVLESDYRGNTLNFTNNVRLGYRIIDGLALSASLGYSDYRLNEFTAMPSTRYNPMNQIGSEASYARSVMGSRQSWIAEPQVNWTRTLGRGTLNTLLGTTFQYETSNRHGQQGYGYPSNALIYDLTASNDQYTFVSENVLYKYQAVFARFNYNWQNKYVVNLTARRDGSSRFSPERQFANFGAVGFAWLFSNEPFVQQVLPFLSFGKLRGSYGLTGNDQIGDYQFLNTYAATGGINYQNIIGLRPQRLYNPDFGWESNQKLEASLEAGIFDDRIYLTATWYRNRSDNQLVGIPLPGTTGFPSLQANLGAKVQNTGWELELQTTPVQTEAFSWKLSANLTIPRNTLLAFPELASSTYSNTYIVGQPLSIVQRYRMTGIDPQTGIYQYEDVNGDGQLSATYDRPVVRNIASHYFGGVTNNVTWRRWQLDAFFQFVKSTRNNYLYSIPYPGAFLASITTRAASQIWRPGVVDAEIQVLATGSNQAANNAWSRLYASDAAVSDTYYIRLRNLALSYAIPDQWLGGVNANLFFQAQNLFTLTDFTGVDPEMESMQALAPLKTYNFGFQLTF